MTERELKNQKIKETLAKTILHAGRCKTNYIPMGHREFKPVENKTSVNFDLSKFVSYDSAKQEAQGFILG